VRAISLWQPWASLIAIDAKRIETRSWPANYKGIIAIHAAKRPIDDAGFALMLNAGISPVNAMLSMSRTIGLPLGSIVAICTIVDSLLIDQATSDTMPQPEKSFGDYTPGRYAWLMTNLHKLEAPVPCVGRQRLFNLPDDVEAKVRAQVPSWAFVGANE
jgi:activating signal cointegrator 1